LAITTREEASSENQKYQYFLHSTLELNMKNYISLFLQNTFPSPSNLSALIKCCKSNNNIIANKIAIKV